MEIGWNFPLLAVGFAVSLAGQSDAASFDCAKGKSYVEITICGSASLSSLDSNLAKSYKTLLQVTPDRGSLRAEQRKWLINRDQCGNSSCVEEAYTSRLNELYLQLDALGQGAMAGTQCSENSLGSCNWAEICQNATVTINGRTVWKSSEGEPWVGEAELRNLDCGVSD